MSRSFNEKPISESTVFSITEIDNIIWDICNYRCLAGSSIIKEGTIKRFMDTKWSSCRASLNENRFYNMRNIVDNLSLMPKRILNYDFIDIIILAYIFQRHLTNPIYLRDILDQVQFSFHLGTKSSELQKIRFYLECQDNPMIDSRMSKTMYDLNWIHLASDFQRLENLHTCAEYDCGIKLNFSNQKVKMMRKILYRHFLKRGYVFNEMTELNNVAIKNIERVLKNSEKTS